MSVYKHKKSPFYQYAFAIDRHRFSGSTKCTSRREAEAKEREIKAQSQAEITAAVRADCSLRIDDVSERYWRDVGQHHAGADNTDRLIGWLVKHFGENKPVPDITHDDVAKMVSERRLDIVPNSKPPRTISPYTVNDTTEQLKKLFTYLKQRGIAFRLDTMPKWRDLMLAEPQERVRELHADEADRLDEAMRDDYEPLFEFVRITGKRQSECYTLRWEHVHWDTGWIERPGKGGRMVRVSITDTIRDVLWPLRGHHPEFVFTYVAQRTAKGLIKDRRYPITKSGLKTRWRRTRTAARLTGFRFHDFRHDVATKMLRKTGNLKLVQKALDHQDIKTTARYAHVMDKEVGAAMEAVATESRGNHRNNHRNKSIKVV